MENMNTSPPFLGRRLPDYPPLLQLLRVTAATVAGPASIGSAAAGTGNVAPSVLYVASTQQSRTDTLSPRDREPCLVFDPNGVVLSAGYYLGRLCNSYQSLPVYEVVAVSASGVLGPAGPSGSPGVSTITVKELATPGGVTEVTITGVSTLQFSDPSDDGPLVLSSPGVGVAEVEFFPAGSANAGYVTAGDQNFSGTKSLIAPTLGARNSISYATMFITGGGSTALYSGGGISYGFDGQVCGLQLFATDNNHGSGDVAAGNGGIYNTHLYVYSVGTVANGVPYTGGGVNLTSTTGSPVYAINNVRGITQVVVLSKITPGGANGSLTITGGIPTSYNAPT